LSLPGIPKSAINSQRLKTLHEFDGEGSPLSTSLHLSMIESNAANTFPSPKEQSF
jgi:hypothetical protein